MRLALLMDYCLWNPLMLYKYALRPCSFTQQEAKCTRKWFEWANAMLVVYVENSLGEACDQSADAQFNAKVRMHPTYLECMSPSHGYEY